MSNAARDARRRLLDELHAQGMDVEELRRVVAEDKLVLAPVARELSLRGALHGPEIARRPTSTPSFLAASRRAPRLRSRVPTSACMREGTRGGAARPAHRAAASTTRRARGRVRPRAGDGALRRGDARAGRAHVHRAGLDEYELAQRYRAVAEQLMPRAGPWLEHVSPSTFAGPAQRCADAGAAPLKLDDTQEAVIAFADLVGFTELGESVPVEELGTSRPAVATGERGVRTAVKLVKLIGDAVMLVCLIRSRCWRPRCGSSNARPRTSATRRCAGVACGQAVHGGATGSARR